MVGSEPFGLGMLTRHEAERLAVSVNAIRPDWPVSSLLTFLKERHTRPLMDLVLELTYVAWDADSKSPARIDVDGPWKRLRHVDKAVATVRTITADDCDICTKPAHAHPVEPFDPNDPDFKPHEYVQRGSLGPGQAPTPEQRAAINAANADAQAKVNAAREAVEGREVRDMGAVLASHANESTEESA